MNRNFQKIFFLLVIWIWGLIGNKVYATELIPIDENTFPDADFQVYVLQETIDTNQDGMLSLEEREAIVEIGLEDVEDATGLEWFPNLKKLSFKNGLKKMDLSKNTEIKQLIFNYCNMESIDVSTLTKLEYLCVLDCGLKTIDVSDNTELTDLYLDENMLKEIDLSNNTKLKTVYLNDNQLASIEFQNHIWLSALYINNNQIKELDLSKTTSLKFVEANANPLRKLKLSKLGNMQFNNCQLAAVDVSDCSFLMSGVDKYYTIEYLRVNDNGLPVKVGMNKRIYYANMVGFDCTKVQSITGGICEENYIIWDGTSEKIEYVYDIGKNATRTFAIQPTMDSSQQDIIDNGLVYIENDSNNNNDEGNPSDNDKEPNKEGDSSGGTGGTTGETDSSEEEVITKKINLAKASSPAIVSQQYCGQAITPTITLTYNNSKLVSDKDYTVTYKNNINVGTAQIIIQGCGDYTGTKTVNFQITPFDASKLSTTLKGKDGNIYRATYTKKAIKLKTAFKIATTNDGQKVYLQPKEGNDYTVRFKNNKKIGTASIIYSFKGNYTGTLTKKFQIVPPTTKVTSVKKSGSKLVIKWKKVSSCDRYEVYRATSKNGKYKKIATIKGKNKCAYKDKKVKKGKKYYYKVKACKKVKGTIYKSDFSNVKKGKR